MGVLPVRFYHSLSFGQDPNFLKVLWAEASRVDARRSHAGALDADRVGLAPELLATDEVNAIYRDGHRLDDAEDAAKPLCSRPELQRRGAKAHREVATPRQSSRVDRDLSYLPAAGRGRP
jgi:sRNA-binding protein